MTDLNIHATTHEHKSRPHNITTFKDRDAWIRLFLAADVDTVSARAKIVGTCISLHHNVETGQCDPPIASLMSGTGLSESTVYRMLLELEASGWIAANRTGGRHRNSYELRTPTLSEVTGFNPVNSDRVQDTPTLSPVTPQPCHPRQGNPVTRDTPNDKRIDKRIDKRRRESLRLDLGDEDSGRRQKEQPDTIDADFGRWYEQYPKKIAKAAAEKAYRTVISKNLATAEELLAGAMRAAADFDQRANLKGRADAHQYTKNPATWLNGQCWLDEHVKPADAQQVRPTSPAGNNHINTAMVIARQIQERKLQEGNNVGG